VTGGNGGIGRGIALGLSMYALFGAAFAPSYSAAKGGVVQLTKSMAIELAPFNVQVNALAPGFIETDLTTFMKIFVTGATVVVDGGYAVR
jgi:2-dehydro-3-deoxy-D-gluconate 5-dehydrogenase